MFRKLKKRYSKWKIWRKYYVSLSLFDQILVLLGFKYKTHFDMFKVHEEDDGR